MVYTDVTTVRSLTGYTVSDISDADLTFFIDRASEEFNSTVNITVHEKPTMAKGNDYKTFYLKKRYFADNDDDFDVTVNDIVFWAKKTDEEDWVQQAVASIDIDNSKIVLSSALTSDYEFSVEYKYAPVREDSAELDPLVKKAVSELTGHYASARIAGMATGTGTVKEYNIGGDFKVSYNATSTNAMENSFSFYFRYKQTLGKIMSGSLIREKKGYVPSQLRSEVI